MGILIAPILVIFSRVRKCAMVAGMVITGVVSGTSLNEVIGVLEGRTRYH